MEVLGPDTSGEAEPVIVSMQDGFWVGVGSDHTDRKAETMGIALSKQLCAKVVGTTCGPSGRFASKETASQIAQWRPIIFDRARKKI